MFFKVIFTFIFGLFFSCYPAPFLQAKLKIIITNDVHGHLMTEPGRGRIGYALLKSYISKLEKEGWLVYLLDAGDAFSGSAYAQADHGRFVAKMMGLMGYRVLLPGNHAFDYNEAENNPYYYSDVLLATVKENSITPLIATASNLTLNGHDFPGLQRAPAVIFYDSQSPDGLRLIVAGVITPYTARSSLKDSLPGYDFGLLGTTKKTKRKIINDLTAALKPYNRPADVVIVLSHVGYAGPDGDGEERLTGLDLAQTPNVDFIADGHSHTAIKPRLIGKVFYGNGGRYLEHFLEITLERGGTKNMVLKDYNSVSALKPDSEIEKSVLEFEQRQGLSEILFKLPQSDLFSDKHIKNSNTPLGRLICREMMEATGADFALHNIGGIRSGLAAGPVSFRDFYDVLPFGDKLVTTSMSGHEIHDMFKQGSGHGGRGLAQFYGISVYAWSEGKNIKIAGLVGQDGKVILMEKQYTVAMNGFMAKRMAKTVYDHGKLLQSIKKSITAKADLELERLTVMNDLFIFTNQKTALHAMKKAEH